jgi:DNA polymerase
MEVEAVTGKQRQMGKVMELGCGYGGGVGAFLQFAKTYELDLTELGRVVPGIISPGVYAKAETNWKKAFIQGADFRLESDVYIACDALKQIYRTANPKITQLWWDVERAIRWAIERRGSVHFVARCKIWSTKGWLIIELPSDRRLMYANPDTKVNIEYDDETEEIKKRVTLRYMAAKNKQWMRERSYGGKFVENFTQAIANDVLRASMLRARAAGYPQILHIHDEQVVEAPIGVFDLDDFLRLMECQLWWSEGLPLKAAGFVGPRYKKDD